MRVVGIDQRIVDQNTSMRRWTDVALEGEQPTCNRQLKSELCGTDRCPVKRLRSESMWIHETETDVTLPDGETRHVLVITEHYRDRKGDDRFLQSFSDLTALDRTDEATEQKITVPEPVDRESFREGMKYLLERAKENDVSFANRSWDCAPEGEDLRWDIDIARVNLNR